MWLECNGQSTVAYPALAAIIGAVVPDYRGLFLRGYGNQTSSDSYGTVLHQSASLGILQTDSIRNISGRINLDNYGGNNFLTGAFYTKYEGIGGAGSSGSAYIAYFDASKIVPTSNENRPVNKAVRYLIKAQ